MIVRLLKPWKFRKVGTVLNDVPDGVANTLIKRKVVEQVQHVEQVRHVAKEQVRGRRAIGA